MEKWARSEMLSGYRINGENLIHLLRNTSLRSVVMGEITHSGISSVV